MSVDRVKTIKKAEYGPRESCLKKIREKIFFSKIRPSKIFRESGKTEETV